MDKYSSFQSLRSSECEGSDFRVECADRGSRYLILAPHGGFIEPGTSEVARSLAGADLSFYCFEGLRPGRAHTDLHITSTSFDEPEALSLIARCEVPVAIHGRADRDDPEAVWMGGLHEALAAEMTVQLNQAGFTAATPHEEISGRSPRNICNRGRLGRGVQMELPRTLRSILSKDKDKLHLFCEAVKKCLD